MPWGQIQFIQVIEVTENFIHVLVGPGPRALVNILGSLGMALLSAAVFSGGLVIQGLMQGKGRRYKFRRNNKLYRL